MSDFCCEADMGDCVPCDLYSEKMVRVKKPCKCIECGAEILLGSYAKLSKGKCDGELFTDYTCTVCLRIGKEHFCHGWWVPGQLYKDIARCMDIEMKDLVGPKKE